MQTSIKMSYKWCLQIGMVASTLACLYATEQERSENEEYIAFGMVYEKAQKKNFQTLLALLGEKNYQTNIFKGEKLHFLILKKSADAVPRG